MKLLHEAASTHEALIVNEVCTLCLQPRPATKSSRSCILHTAMPDDRLSNHYVSLLCHQ